MRALKRVFTALLVATAVVAASATSGVATAKERAPKFAADPTTLVDTSIGNNGDGTTFPGAADPFGMVQLSPDTQLNQYASYDYKQDTILGFSHTHLSGVGCQTMGNFRFMPTTGAVTSSDPAQYGAKFSHDNETRAPGYYGVKFDNGIQAELTATQRTGQHRYTYPAGSGPENVLIEVGESNGSTYAGDVKVVGNDTVEGWLQGGNFCGETGKERYRIFFSAKFDRKFSSFGTWTDGTLTPNQRDSVARHQARRRLGDVRPVQGRPGRCLGGAVLHLDRRRAPQPQGRAAEVVRQGPQRGARHLAGRAEPHARGRRQHRRPAHVLQRALPLAAAPVDRVRRGQPLPGLRRQGAPRGFHVLPDVLALGHLPRAEPAGGPAAPGQGRGHGQVRAAHLPGRRLAAALGARQQRDQRDERRSHHPVDRRCLQPRPARQTDLAPALRRALEERQRGPLGPVDLPRP